MPAGYHRDDLRFYALIETVRMGVPPRALATYYLDAARVEVEEVTPAVLDAALARTIDGTRKLIEVLRAQRAAMVSPGRAVRLVPHPQRLLGGHGVLERADGVGMSAISATASSLINATGTAQAGGGLDRGDPATGLHRRLGRAHEVGPEEVDRLVEGGHRERQAPERGRAAGRVGLGRPHQLQHHLAHAEERLAHLLAGGVAVPGAAQRQPEAPLDGADRAVEVGRAHDEVVDDLGTDQVGRRQPAERRRFAVARSAARPRR